MIGNIELEHYDFGLTQFEGILVNVNDDDSNCEDIDEENNDILPQFDKTITFDDLVEAENNGDIDFDVNASDSIYFNSFLSFICY